MRPPRRSTPPIFFPITAARVKPAPSLSLPKLGYASASQLLLLGGLIAFAVADMAVTALDPWAEMRRLLAGVLRPDIVSVELRSVVLTVAFAVIGVGLGASAGFAMALVFQRRRAVRLLAAFIRSVHELFWALLLIQIAGLSPTTGILAIAIPYSGIFAKVFSEMIEEADLSTERVLPVGTSLLSRFTFVRVPVLAEPFRTYTLYRLECGLRSTLVLGFIGLPTIGFNLESYFRQGHYAEAAALVLTFYGLIGTRRLWARAATLPVLVAAAIASLVLLVEPVGGASPWSNLARFLGHDIVPSPLRGADLMAAITWSRFGHWLWPIVTTAIAPGSINTLVLSQMALVATAALSLLIFPAICERFAGRSGKPLGRVVLVVVRSTPEYMLAYVLLQLIGPSMLPAVLALAFHNGGIVGYLMGRNADALTYRPDAPAGLDLYLYETVPRLYGQFLAFVLYRWEIIVRESAIFGILGVRTLGYHVDAAISELRLDVAVILILATAALSMLIDAFSHRLRRRLRIDTMPTRLSSAPDEPGIQRGALACTP
jgi:phosphonate transport system permease protein